MMTCPACHGEMILENAFDLGEGLTQTDFSCENEEECGISISVYQRRAQRENE